MLSEEQTEEIKKKVIGQIESTFPEDKKQAAISQIESMNSEQLEKFLEQNKLTQQNQAAGEQCIFCMINSNQISSYKLDEGKNAIAILEINPVSKAHSLIIPKKHLGSEEIGKDIRVFTEKLSKKINAKFKPKEMIVSESNLFGHKVLNLIPVYENESIDSERYKAEKKELEEVQKILTKKTERKIIEKAKKTKAKKSPAKKRKESKKSLWLPKRIP